MNTLEEKKTLNGVCEQILKKLKEDWRIQVYDLFEEFKIGKTTFYNRIKSIPELKELNKEIKLFRKQEKKKDIKNALEKNNYNISSTRLDLGIGYRKLIDYVNSNFKLEFKIGFLNVKIKTLEEAKTKNTPLKVISDLEELIEQKTFEILNFRIEEKTNKKQTTNIDAVIFNEITEKVSNLIEKA